jgi:hypothetical protein
MKFTLALVAAFVAFASTANASLVSERHQARLECIAEARAMGHIPNTVKWRNAVKDCMIERDFNGG